MKKQQFSAQKARKYLKKKKLTEDEEIWYRKNQEVGKTNRIKINQVGRGSASKLKNIRSAINAGTGKRREITHENEDETDVQERVFSAAGGRPFSGNHAFGKQG